MAGNDLERFGSVAAAAGLLIAVAACGPTVALGEDSSTSAAGSTSVTADSDGLTSTSEAGTAMSITTEPDPATSTVTTDSPGSTSSPSDGSSTGPDHTPVPGECDVWRQDCPPGEKCNAYADGGGSVWNAVACFPVVAQPDGPGAPCMVEESGSSGFDTCALGSMCWSVGDDLQGECAPLCTGSELDPACESPDRTCVIANEGAVILCLRNCDPDDVTPCPEGELCFPTDGGWVCAPGVDDGPETCDVSSCSPGTVCVIPDLFGPECEAETGCCADYCELDAPRCSRPQHTCVALYPEDPPPGFENVGVCVLP